MTQVRNDALGWTAGALLLLGAAGCGPPTLGDGPDKANYQLVMQLNTALAGKRPELLEATAARLAERHAAGKMSAAAHTAIAKIVERAKGGDWVGAQADCLAFQKGQ
ncbi:MAG: hypothetical protein ACRDD1_05765 [Planctomycetia bacterium]